MTMIRKRKIGAAVVGATGLAGQQFLAALNNHPWIEVLRLAASPRSAGKRYDQAICAETGASQWFADGPLPPKFASMIVEDALSMSTEGLDIVFSCVESAAAKELEARFARSVPVVSTASAFRYEEDVPLLLPGTNPEHAVLLQSQREQRGWKGFIAPNPNCTTVGLAMTLAPLHRAFGIDHVHVVSMQAVSGAGRSSGVIALDVIDNIIPLIPKEEAKVALETKKILGTLAGGRERGRIIPATFGISATCTRVAVIEGHTLVVHVSLGDKLGREILEEDISAAWAAAGRVMVGVYPTAPKQLIAESADPYRPQVRLDRDAGDGLTTVVGRLRRDPQSLRGWQYVAVSHNTKMGAAKGCILAAEQLIADGLVGSSITAR